MTTQMSHRQSGRASGWDLGGKSGPPGEAQGNAGSQQLAVASRRTRQLFTLMSLPGFLPLSLSNGLTQSFGQRIQGVAVAWLVLDLTGSPLWVGVINGLPATAIVLFSLTGGLLADSREPRRVLMLARTGLAVMAAVMALLTLVGGVSTGYLLAYVLVVVGIAAIDMPVSRRLTHSVVGTEWLLSAGAAQSVFVNLVNISAPLMMGFLIGLGGPGASFVLLAAGYFVSLGLLHRAPKASMVPLSVKGPVQGGVAAGLSYILATPVIAGLVGLAFLVPIAGIYFALVPVYAREVLEIDAGGLGLLVASFSAGSLASSLYLAMNGAARHRGRWLTLLGVGFGIGMVAFGLSNSFVIAIAISASMGGMAGFWQNMLIAVVQTAAAPHVRGRVVAIVTMGFQLIGLGWLLSGLLATAMPLETVLVGAGVVFTVVSALVFVVNREFREMD